MLDDTIKCCSLFESFVRRYRDRLCLELTELEGSYVLELRGDLHVESAGSAREEGSCGGCISCGPPRPPAKAGEPWRIEPLEMVWRHCPFCGGNFVRPGD